MKIWGIVFSCAFIDVSWGPFIFGGHPATPGGEQKNIAVCTGAALHAAVVEYAGAAARAGTPALMTVGD
eukprot:6142134-Pyramimonas_sp.AAC.1